MCIASQWIYWPCAMCLTVHVYSCPVNLLALCHVSDGSCAYLPSESIGPVPCVWRFMCVAAQWIYWPCAMCLTVNVCSSPVNLFTLCHVSDGSCIYLPSESIYPVPCVWRFMYISAQWIYWHCAMCLTVYVCSCPVNLLALWLARGRQVSCMHNDCAHTSVLRL